MDKSDKELQELLKKFIMLSALAKEDSQPDPLPVFLSPVVAKTEEVKPQVSSESRFPALRAKLAKAEQTSEEMNSSEE